MPVVEFRRFYFGFIFRVRTFFFAASDDADERYATHGTSKGYPLTCSVPSSRLPAPPPLKSKTKESVMGHL